MKPGRLASALSGVILTLLGLLFITFVMGRLLPIDPVVAVVGDNAPTEVYERVRREMRLDQPIHVQAWHYAADMARGRLGVSVTTGSPIASDLQRFVPATFELATVAIVVGALLGVPLGFVCARMAGRWPDHIGRVVALAGNSLPVFWLGLIGLLVFYARLGWVGGPGRIDIAFQYSIPEVTGLLLVDTLLAGDTAAFASAVSHLVLPAGILGLLSMSYLARMTRSFVLSQLQQDYVAVARLKGLSEARILWHHVLPNVAGPIVALLAWTYAHLLEGTVLTETVFAWPGLGSYITQSLLSADLPAVLASTLVVGVVFVGLNLLAEVMQAWLDPRTRP